MIKRAIFLLALIANCGLFLAQSVSNFIVVDQFGYLPGAPKVAVIRDPVEGFDAAQSFTPGSTYALVNAITKAHVFTGAPVAWSNGSTHAASGDRAWWFDFSQVTTIGSYYVLDIQNNVRSHEFMISPAVYNDVFKHAFRTFFYQRVGFAKQAPFASPGWSDGASHVGPLQDRQARLFSSPGNPATERDVSGAWYDAGDYNKYTNWTADYVIGMMYAFLENPAAWTDDFNIPESGNGIPDLLDEARWGIDHLLRMQNLDGGVLSIVGLSQASPPSAATGPSLYGPPSTSATLTTAGAFAIAAVVFRSIGMVDYADVLVNAATRAWNWAELNPAVTFRNNDPNPPYNSANLGAGQQEVDDYGRLTKAIQAACFLFAATGEARFRQFFDNNYLRVNMMEWWFAFPFQSANQDMLLFYTSLAGATPAVVAAIRQRYHYSIMTTPDNWPSVVNRADPYRAYIKDYTWGSNSTKSIKANMFLNAVRFNAGAITEGDARNAALGYLNYLHGVNPLNMVYLSNMFHFGAENGVREFFHAWFADGSHLWDRVGTSVHGPPPGFLTGGPNPFYNWDGCCPSGCGSVANNARCVAESIIPPRNQPAQKSYKDFNTSWPLNSWEISENSNGYQINYLRLLANFVNPRYDCNGVLNGNAVIDVCGRCAGGNTGIIPQTNPANCISSVTETKADDNFILFPNPAGNRLYITSANNNLTTTADLLITIFDTSGRVAIVTLISDNNYVDISSLPSGAYLIQLDKDDELFSQQFLVKR